MKKIISSLFLLLFGEMFYGQFGPGTGIAQPISKDVWVLVLCFVVLALGSVFRVYKQKAL